MLCQSCTYNNNMQVWQHVHFTTECSWKAAALQCKKTSRAHDVNNKIRTCVMQSDTGCKWAMKSEIFSRHLNMGSDDMRAGGEPFQMEDTATQNWPFISTVACLGAYAERPSCYSTMASSDSNISNTLTQEYQQQQQPPFYDDYTGQLQVCIASPVTFMLS